MKYLAFLLLALVLLSCDKNEPSYSIIHGTLENSPADFIVVTGNKLETKIPVSADRTFSDTLHLHSDGFYQLYAGREQTEIYLEKGKNLTINMDGDNFDESLKFSGDLATENNYLNQRYLWNETHIDYKDLYSSDEDTFIKKLDANQKAMDSLYKVHKIKNPNFEKISQKENEYLKATHIENYVDAHRYLTGIEDYQVESNFYNPLKDINYADTLAFRNSLAYQNMLDAHFNRLVNEETYESGDNEHTLLFMKKVNSSLPDGYAKDKIMFNYLHFGLKPDNSLEEAFNIYKNSNPNPDNLMEITGRYNKLQTLIKGKASPTFNYENHKGGKTSLADLKGKYVYIDVWATWCGPCLREIPALKEREKEYQSKNIEFVSISIDEPKDYDKWKNMVTEKSLAGVQLMADNNWNSEFVKDYGILGIPRFILLDPDGNIVSADAPRPSDPMLKKTLDALL
ncbi:TlpA family protein disulfide reductase [Aequorivita sp. H23M31]|uniref:TlpA family protein disulfide reductase n=1 Tax=Aequorivita ciconiae TaxID=2494375 RepID=A0A410G2N7_9FLAO|nr:TlpA disulfide reductase family protein [Aequorivita sp. H23M31]QAA81509.1 TlpA family protein disulfide reductase [Aequorivita sp. H23M31]